MSCSGMFSVLMTILASLLACSMAPLAIASINEGFRQDVTVRLRQMRSAGWGTQFLRKAVEIWLSMFVHLFGVKIFSWKYFVFTPIYTLSISMLFIIVWIVPKYVHFYWTHSFADPAYMNVGMKEGLRQWFSHGIWIAIGLDYVSVFITKIGLRTLVKKEFGPTAFALFSAGLVIFIYFLFTIIVFLLRVYDMVSLYIAFAPEDSMPIVEYEFFPKRLGAWASLQTVTTIYVTSRGWISTYFFPEQILFYGMAATITTLPLVAMSYIVVFTIERLMSGVGMVFQTSFNPDFGARNIVLIVSFVTCSLFVIVAWLLTALSGRCLPSG